MAASMPSLVSSLAVVDSTGIPLGSLPEVLLRRSIELPAQLGSIKMGALIEMWQSSTYNWFFRPQNVFQTALISLNEDLRPLLSNIESPCLVMWGEKDCFIPLKLGQELAQGIKGSRLVVVEGEYHELVCFVQRSLQRLSLTLLMKLRASNKAKIGARQAKGDRVREMMYKRSRLMSIRPRTDWRSPLVFLPNLGAPSRLGYGLSS
jgi:hypothetical protein